MAAALVALGGVLLASCAGDDGGGPSSTTARPPATGPATAGGTTPVGADVPVGPVVVGAASPVPAGPVACSVADEPPTIRPVDDVAAEWFGRDVTPPEGAELVLDGGGAVPATGTDWFVVDASELDQGSGAVRLHPTDGVVEGVSVDGPCRLLDVVEAGGAQAVLLVAVDPGDPVERLPDVVEVHVAGGDGAAWSHRVDAPCRRLVDVAVDGATVRCALIDGGRPVTVTAESAEVAEVPVPCPGEGPDALLWRAGAIRAALCQGSSPILLVVDERRNAWPTDGVAIPAVDGATTWIVVGEGIERLDGSGPPRSVGASTDLFRVGMPPSATATVDHLVVDETVPSSPDQPVPETGRLLVLGAEGEVLAEHPYRSYIPGRSGRVSIRLAVGSDGVWVAFLGRIWHLPLP